MKRGRIGENGRQARHSFSEQSTPVERQSCRIAAASFRDGVVLHDARTGRLFHLNHTAAHMWRSLRAGGLEETIVADLAHTHQADPAAVRHDLEAFVEELHGAGLLGLRKVIGGHAALEARPPQGAPALDAAYRVGEVTVRVVCHPAEVAAAFAPLAAPAMVPDGAAEVRLTLFRDHGGFMLVRGDRAVEFSETAPAARWALVRQLVLVARRSPCLALLHAGAVGTPAGCLLICGESGAGKSTLLAGLVHAGFAFVADDIVPLEQGAGLVWPMRLAISIKQDSWPLVVPLFPKLARAPIIRFGGRTMRYLWPDDDALASSATGCRVAAVLFPQYAEDMPATLRQLDPVRSLTLLGEGGSILPSTDCGLEEFLAWWSLLPAYQLSYGRLGEAVSEVSTLAGRVRAATDRGANAALAPSTLPAED